MKNKTLLYIGISLALIVIVLILIFIPPKPMEISVSAKCGALQTFECRLGILNYPRSKLGQVFALNKNSKQVVFIGVLDVKDEDTTKDAPTAEVSEQFKVSLNIELETEVPADVSAQLKSRLENAGQLRMRNVQRTTLSSPMDLLTQPLGAHIADYQKHNPDDVVCLVHSVVTADTLELSLSDQREGETGSDFKVAKFVFKVSMNCDQIVEIVGGATSVFFKAMAVGYDSQEDKFYQRTDLPLVFTEYNLTHR